ncbi:pilus assembly protein [Bacillus timonensis]|uniref:Pilus assembly protein n=1 Tax=Bacillus timonensis TaxID=1033734 RepID=A0A4S3PN98_9BACI|nr:TadE family protein [Bacillus timonensis]THE10605.1 pilus assembly protein [Bacillus timonensis]
MIRKQNGQGIVEMALSITLLLFIVFGIIDFGRIFSAYLTLNHASREAARVASVGGSNEDIRRIAVEATELMTSELVKVNISPESGRSRGEFVTIAISYPVSLTTPLLDRIVPNPFQLKNETTMRVE